MSCHLLISEQSQQKTLPCDWCALPTLCHRAQQHVTSHNRGKVILLFFAFSDGFILCWGFSAAAGAGLLPQRNFLHPNLCRSSDCCCCFTVHTSFIFFLFTQTGLFLEARKKAGGEVGGWMTLESVCVRLIASSCWLGPLIMNSLPHFFLPISGLIKK